MLKSCLVSCIVLVLYAMPPQASEYPEDSALGTLFTSPSERQQLDEIRLHVLAAETTRDNPVLVKTSRITVKGLVMKNGSTPVVWLNETNTMKNNTLGNVLVRIDGIKKLSTKIPIKVSQKNIKIMPGQQWDEGSNQVEDIYLTK